MTPSDEAAEAAGDDERPNEDTMTLGLEVGKQITRHLTLSGQPSIKVYGSEELARAFQALLTHRFDRGRRAAAVAAQNMCSCTQFWRNLQAFPRVCRTLFQAPLVA